MCGVQRRRSKAASYLGEQAVDLAADERDSGVGLLGEQLVARAAPGESREQALVVPEAKAERRGHDPLCVRVSGDVAQLNGVSHAGIGVPVADEQHRGTGGAGGA
jgi:hypothetical protein